MNAYEALEKMKAPGKKRIILDTDTYNEVDDQFALAYAMLSDDRIDLLSVNAAPFLNSRSVSPADGMEKSYAEIRRIMDLTDRSKAASIPVYRGSERFTGPGREPVESDACRNIIETVTKSDETVFIVAIGAITNLSSAISLCPEVAEKAVIVWLGGHALDRPDTKEFNLKQDIAGAQILFDSGAAICQIPCDGVCSQFITTVPELEYYLRGKNALCDYLCDITAGYTKDPYGWSKVIWDVTAVAALTLPAAEDKVVIPRPWLTSDCRWAHDAARKPYIYVRKLRRDPIYADLFRKLSSL